jgi:hypothetical protein
VSSWLVNSMRLFAACTRRREGPTGETAHGDDIPNPRCVVTAEHHPISRALVCSFQAVPPAQPIKAARHGCPGGVRTGRRLWRIHAAEEQTIGSPWTLNEVLITTGVPEFVVWCGFCSALLSYAALSSHGRYPVREGQVLSLARTGIPTLRRCSTGDEHRSRCSS